MTAASARETSIEGTLRRDHLAMMAIVLVVGGWLVAFGERFPLGFVWDADWYVREAIDFAARFDDPHLNVYRIRRMLPSGLVHLGMVIAGVERTPDAAMTGFAVLDLLLVAGTCWLWAGVAERLGIGRRGRWLGFVGLFANYAILKHAFYIPAMTEIPAFAMGMLALRCWLGRHQLALAGLGIAGAFVFPTVAPSIALMLVWPRGAPSTERDHGVLGWLVGAAVAAAFVAAFGYLYLLRGHRTAGYGPITPVVESVVLLSVAITLAHLLLGVRALVGGVDLPWMRRALRALRLRDIALVGAVLLLPAAIADALANAENTVMTPRIFLGFITFLPNTRPWVQVVSHAAWFGPLVLLLVLRWRATTRLAWELGPSLPLMLGFAFIVAMTPESRQSAFAWPVLVALLVAALEREGRITGRLLAVVVAGALALSHFWRPLNTTEMLAGPRGPVLDNGRAAWLFREYLVQAGPWMPNDAYLLHLATVLPILALLLLALDPRPGDAAVDRGARPP